MNKSARILETATRLASKDGAGWLKYAAAFSPANDTPEAWPGVVRGAIGLVTGTGSPDDLHKSVQWITWGERIARIEDAHEGDTVVFDDDGDFYVGLLVSRQGDEVKVIGGTSKGAISTTIRDLRKLKYIRR